MVKTSVRSPLSFLYSRPNRPSPQPLHIRLPLQTLPHPHDPSSNAFQWLNVILKSWCLKWHTIFKMRLSQCRAERDNPLPCPAGDAVPDAPQDMDVPPGCQGTADSHSTGHGPGTPGPFLQLLSSLSFPSPYTQPGLPHPSAGSGTCPC